MGSVPVDLAGCMHAVYTPLERSISIDRYTSQSISDPGQHRYRLRIRIQQHLDGHSYNPCSCWISFRAARAGTAAALAALRAALLVSNSCAAMQLIEMVEGIRSSSSIHIYTIATYIRSVACLYPASCSKYLKLPQPRQLRHRALQPVRQRQCMLIPGRATTRAGLLLRCRCLLHRCHKLIVPRRAHCSLPRG